MKYQHKLVYGSLAIVLGVVAFLLFRSVALISASPGIIYVAPNANCSGVTPCYGNVQDAVDNANDGDEIRVAAGTYTHIVTRESMTQSLYLNKTLTLRGGYNTTNWAISNPLVNITVLDAQQSGRVISIIGSITPTLENFKFTGGYAEHGGGVYVFKASATISNCTIYSNTAFNSDWGMGGGGVHLKSTSSRLIHNTIVDNVAYRGGGIYVWASSTTIVEGNHLANNKAHYWGGGAYIHFSGATLQHNIIEGNLANGDGGGIGLQTSYATVIHNTVTNNSTLGDGGGISSWEGDTSTLIGNMVINNTANRRGGGIEVYESPNITLDSNTVVGNLSQGNGGGIWIYDSPQVLLINNIVASNAITSGLGAGICLQGSNARIYHATISSNSGGDGSGLYAGSLAVQGSQALLTNTILVNQVAGVNVSPANTVTLYATLWNNNGNDFVGDGVFSHTLDYSGDPSFHDESTADYHITYSSAALDVGVNNHIISDIDGNRRSQGTAPDLGADEIEAARLPADVDSQVIFAYPDGITTELHIPSSAVTESLTLIYASNTSTTAPMGFLFAGRAFNLETYRGGILLDTMFFNPAATIFVYYTDADVIGMDEEQLYLYNWNPTSEIWEDAACGNYSRYPDKNWLSVPICHLSQFALFGSQAAQPSATITKGVSPDGQVQYANGLTYTLVVSGVPGTEVGVYDPLTSTTFLHFAEQSTGIEYANGAITGTLMITPTNQMTVSFVVQVDVPGTIGIYVDVSNTACIYPAGQTISMCEWSNTVTNQAYRPYTIFLPLVVRNQ